MPFDILWINETRLDKTFKTFEVEIQGYNITRRDRDRNGERGGSNLST